MAGPAYFDAFRRIVVQPDNITIAADAVDDTLTLIAGPGISLVANASSDQLTIVNTNTSSPSTELFAKSLTVDGIIIDTNVIRSTDSNANLELYTNGTGAVLIEGVAVNGTTIDSADSSALTFTPDVVFESGVTIGNHLVPSSNENIDLGSSTNRFRDLYLSGSSIKLGGATITSTGSVVNLPVGSTVGGSVIGPGGDNPFDQDLNTTDSPNFVNLGLAGTSGAGYATLSVTIDRDFYIGLNDTSTGAKTFEFSRDGTLIVPGALYVDGNVYGGAGDRLYLAGDIGESVPAIEIPNSEDGATTPLSINNSQGGGVEIITAGGTSAFEDDGSLLLDGSIYVDGDIYGGAGSRLYLSGDEGVGAPNVNIPNAINGASTPIAIDNQFGGGIQIQTSTGNWLFDDTRFLHFPSSTADDYNIGESVDGFNIRSDVSFGIATNFNTEAKYWTFGNDAVLTFPDGGEIQDAAGELAITGKLNGQVSITTLDDNDGYVTFFNSDGSITLGGSLTFLDSTVQTTAWTGDIGDDITVGSIRINTNVIRTVDSNANLELAANGSGIVKSLDYFELSDGTSPQGEWTAYTPTWTAASSNPSIGDGVIEGRYKQVGKTVYVWISVAMGSTTTFGSGEYKVSLPVAARAINTVFLNLVMRDFGTRLYNSLAHNSYSTFAITSDAVTLFWDTGVVTESAPFTWAASDYFTISGTYEAA